MKKTILCLALILLLGASLAACRAPEAHVHTYATEWSYDMYEHWHAASCEHTEQERDRAEHFFEGSVILRETCTEAGRHRLTCAECQYSTEIEVPPAHRFEDGVCTECGAPQE